MFSTCFSKATIGYHTSRRTDDDASWQPRLTAHRPFAGPIDARAAALGLDGASLMQVSAARWSRFPHVPVVFLRNSLVGFGRIFVLNHH